MSAAGWIFIEVLTIGAIVYFAYIFIDDWRETRKFWREIKRNQGRQS